VVVLPAGGAEQAHQAAVLDGERDVVDDRKLAITFRQAAQLD